MTYSDGQEVRIGDKVLLGSHTSGEVVACIDAGAFSEGYSASDWAYLNAGILVESRPSGLLHYPQIDPDLKLVQRAKQTRGAAFLWSARTFIRWLPSVLCWAGAAYCIAGAFQEADFSMSANSIAVAEQYREAAAVYWQGTVILTGLGVILCISLSPLNRR